jgi:hypothetical protein
MTDHSARSDDRAHRQWAYTTRRKYISDARWVVAGWVEAVALLILAILLASQEDAVAAAIAFGFFLVVVLGGWLVARSRDDNSHRWLPPIEIHSSWITPLDGGLRDQVCAAAGHPAERLDGVVDAATLERQPLGLGVQRGLEQLVGGGWTLCDYRDVDSPLRSRDRALATRTDVRSTAASTNVESDGANTPGVREGAGGRERGRRWLRAGISSGGRRCWPLESPRLRRSWSHSSGWRMMTEIRARPRRMDRGMTPRVAITSWTENQMPPPPGRRYVFNGFARNLPEGSVSYIYVVARRPRPYEGSSRLTGQRHEAGCGSA